MKYIKQFGIILLISLAGEILHYFIPLPIPASIYGLVIMLLCLLTGLIPAAAVKETSDFLLEIMPILFIPAAVGLLNAWGVVKAKLPAYILITLSTTVIVMVVSGRVTQRICRREKRKEQDDGTL